MPRTGLIVLTLGLSVLAPASSVVAGEPMVQVVDDDGHASRRDCDSDRPAFTRIQPAIDAGIGEPFSSDVNRVVVCPGTYRGLLQVSNETASVSLEAATRVRPVIEPPPGAPKDAVIITIYTNRLSMHGFHIRPGGAAGAGCSGPARVLVDVRFADFALVDSRLGPDAGPDTACTRYGTAVRVEGDGGSPGFYGSARIHGSTIVGFGRSGVDVAGPSLVTVGGNRFEPRQRDARSTTDVVGIRFDQSPILDGPARMEIRGNLFDARRPSGRFAAVSGGSDDEVTIVDNVGVGATVGIRLTRSAGGFVQGNVLTGRGPDAEPGHGIVIRGVTDLGVFGNMASGFGASGIVVATSSDALILNNDFRRNRLVDCIDRTTGDGSVGTANDWFGNLGDEAEPTGICS